jgi:MFS family permease
MRAQIGTLILATSGVQLANGFFNTLISLRVAIEDFEPTLAGLVLSSYFAGFTFAALRCRRIIERVGHIRAYAAFAGLVVAATATMPLLIGALPWLALRTFVGFGCAGLFITTESWLNAKAQPGERGRVFSLYMVGTFVALAVGQLLIGRAKIETAAPFNAIVALFAVALVMVSTTRAEPPRLPAATNVPYGQLVRSAPVAVGGGVLSGLISSSFYALVPAWMQGEGIARETIAISMLAAGSRSRSQSADSRTASTGASCWQYSALALWAPQPLSSFCRTRCRWSCRPQRCLADLCRPSTRSASPTRTTGCRPTGS